MIEHHELTEFERGLLRTLEDCEGACLYWQLPNPILTAKAVCEGVVLCDGELIVHPRAMCLVPGECYLMPSD